ncbi:RHS repeat-associated core domain-containing protein, partial [Sulfuricella sp. T08]|uniref:RHS repeat-associated core domain-containing protein n=1 Tax=Sulfuricella sp. T08 TaxID=1632857 RepID=UPI000A55FB85
QDIYAEYGAAWTNPNAVYTSGGGVDDPVIKATVTGASSYGQASYYHADGLGSIVGLSNSTDATTQTERFDAWGNKLAGTIPQSAQYGFTGREPDESGLVYYRARYYDPSIGRFTQRDPIGLNGGINLYSYVNNNPVNFNDPNGLLAKVLLADATSAISYAGNTLTDAGQNLQAFGQRVLDSGRNESFADTANKFLQGLGPEVAMVGAAVGSIKAVVTTEQASSRALGIALENDGFAREAGDAAHHIVAGGANAAAEARAILQNFGVGINDAANGVFLPATKALAEASDAVAHAAVHTKEYYDSVTTALLQATSKKEVIDVLSQIRARLLNGGKP